MGKPRFDTRLSTFPRVRYPSHSVLTFRSASERAALRLPRVVKTHSGAPEPQVSRQSDGLSPRASFPDHPRARHPTPQPFPALLVSERRKAHSSSRRPAAVKKHAPASRAGRVHRGRMAGPTYTYVDTPPRAFLGPHALTPAPPPLPAETEAAENLTRRKPVPFQRNRIIRHASHREPRGHAGEQQARASPQRAFPRS